MTNFEIDDLVYKFLRLKILAIPTDRVTNPIVWRVTERIMFSDFQRHKIPISRKNFGESLGRLFPQKEADLDAEGEVIWIGLRYYKNRFDYADLKFLQDSYKPFAIAKAP